MNSDRRSAWHGVVRVSRSMAVAILVSFLVTPRVSAQPPGTFTATGAMTTARSWQTATLLRDGKVLIVAGSSDRPASAELYDPAAGTFTATGDMTTVRSGATATLLRDGKVLIAGGDRFTGNAPLKSSAEVYDPSTGAFTPTGDMVGVQIGGTATLLNNGKVLIAGGTSALCCNPDPAPAANPELYDPSTGTFAVTGMFAGAGDGFSVTGGPNVSAAIVLPDGRVLIAGEPNSELYDPVTGTFSLTGGMTTPCVLGGHPTYIGGRTATLLTNGMVLLAGGAHEDCGRFANAELYDPATGTFTATGNMTRARDNHTATLLLDGSVLITGGESQDCSARGCIFSGTDAGAEIYDPSTATFAAAGSMSERRAGHTATRLRNGAVLVAGGYFYAGIGSGSCCFASAELFAAEGFAPHLSRLRSVAAPRAFALRTVPALPPVNGSFRVPAVRAAGAGAFTAAGDMSRPRFLHTSTQLGDGRVLIAGGSSSLRGGTTVIESSAELYDPSTASFTATGSMTVVRWYHTATLLPNGKVLIAGGSDGSGPQAGAELYDPSTQTFTAAGNMTTARIAATATRLADGRVLIAGGLGDVDGRQAELSSAELYDPSTGTFTATGDMIDPFADTATLLANGTVLLTKSIVGWNPSAIPSEIFVRHAELYDPSTGTFAATGDMVSFHGFPTATLLLDGKVLIAGGDIGDGDGASVKAELYDPHTGAFVTTGDLTTGRESHTATLLPDGTVLIVGGHGGVRVPGGGYDNFASAELYDPRTGMFRTSSDMAIGRELQRATLLNNSSVLMTGGVQYVPFGAGNRQPVFGILASAELYSTATLASPVSVSPPGEIVTENLHPRLEVHNVAASVAVAGVPATDPGVAARPSGLAATASGSGVVLTWAEPRGAAPLRYAISGGNAPHNSTLPVVVTPDASNRYTISALPPGHYYFRVSAILAGGLSLPSDEADVVASGSTSATGAPSGAVALSDGGNFTLTWTRGHEPAAVYYVEIGSAPGQADVERLTTTQSSLTFRADIPISYLRVRGARGAMVSAPSNEVSVSVVPATCATPPLDPVLLPVSTTHGETTISWLPADGPAAEHYRVDGAGPSGPTTMTSSGTGTSLKARLEPGTYTIRVTAINACGASAASNHITFAQPEPSSRSAR